MTTKNKATHLADAIKNSDVEIQLQEIAERGNIYFKDVTFDQSGYPTNVGEYRALVGFKDQQDAKRWAELTDGEFTLFYKEDGWHFLSYRGGARLTNIYQLAGRYPVVLLDGNENLSQLCKKVHGIPLVDYIRGYINNNDVPDAWIRAAVELYETGEYQSPLVINKRDEDYYNKIESDIRECLRYLMNFKGCKGFVVINDVNWFVEGEYNSEYPAHYKEDNEHYIFGVMYPSEKISEISKWI